MLRHQCALAIQHRFQRWADAVERQKSIRQDQLQAAQMLARTLVRNVSRRLRTCWGQWIYVVDGARQKQSDAGHRAVFCDFSNLILFVLEAVRIGFVI